MATRWGIVSAGKICHDFVSAVRSLPGEEHEIVAVAARKLEDAESFAKLHNISKYYDSYEAVAKDPNVQVVYIGNLNVFHYPLGKLMLQNGKHVLLEKPLCINLRETKELLDLAKQKKVFLMEAVWSRFLPAYEHLMKEVKAGSIGDVLCVNVTFGIPIADVDRIKLKDLGGGTLLDIGIYCLSAILMVYENEAPEKVVAVGHLNEQGVDESLSVSLQFSNGRLANMMTSCRVDLPCDLVVVGTKGTLKLPNPMWCSTKVCHGAGHHVDFPLPPTVLPCNFTNSSGLRFEAVEVRRCLNEGLLESPRMSHAHSELFYTIMDDIRRQVGVVYPQDK